MPFVYRLTNKINGTVYVGKANNVEGRIHEHIYYAKGGREKWGARFLVVDAAISKYGFDNFLLETIHETATEDEAYELEETEIARNKKDNIRSYNIGDGGKTNSGWHHTEESRKKISESQSYETRLASLLKNPAMLFAGQTKEAREKSRISNTGKKRNQSFQETNSLNKRGEKNPLVKLNENQVIEIRSSTSTTFELAKIYGVDVSTIRNIKSGRTWKHLL